MFEQPEMMVVRFANNIYTDPIITVSTGAHNDVEGGAAGRRFDVSEDWDGGY